MELVLAFMLTQKQTHAMGFALALFSFDAYAYLDPGTGSAIVQGVIAAIAALGVSLKLYWHRLVRFFSAGRKKGKRTDNPK